MSRFPGNKAFAFAIFDDTDWSTLENTEPVYRFLLELGVPATNLFEVIGVSTGRSWMSNNLIDVQYDLLLKDVGLLRGEIGSLPSGSLDDDVEQAISAEKTIKAWRGRTP